MTYNYYDVVLEIEVSGQYPPAPPYGTGDISKVQLNNTGIYHYPRPAGGDWATTDTVTRTLQHGWNYLSDPANPTNPVLHMMNPQNAPGATVDQKVSPTCKYVVQPLSHDVFLNLNGTRYDGTGKTQAQINADLLALHLNFTRYPTMDWSSFIV